MEDAEAQNPQHPQNNTKASDKSSAPPQNLPPQKQAALVEEALDLTCTHLINEISIRVMLESEDGDMRKTYSPLTAEELADYNKLVDSPNKINPSSVFLSSPTTSTDHAELGGSTSPTVPLLALDCGVAAPTLVPHCRAILARRWIHWPRSSLPPRRTRLLGGWEWGCFINRTHMPPPLHYHTTSGAASGRAG